MKKVVAQLKKKGIDLESNWDNAVSEYIMDFDEGGVISYKALVADFLDYIKAAGYA